MMKNIPWINSFSGLILLVQRRSTNINSQLHSKYEEMKSVMYTEYSDLKKECFINILAKVIMDWATPEKLVKAGKRVGITSKGLCRVDGPGHV